LTYYIARLDNHACARRRLPDRSRRDGSSPVTSGRSGPNINPVTGLSTDYLNHFTEAIMLLELLPAVPDCVADFLAWEPKDYREHFRSLPFQQPGHGHRRL
jgi:hypothetical protein